MSNIIDLKKLIIFQYEHSEDIIDKLKSLIHEKYSFLFKAVIVHGSIATNEVVFYSDFDGLIIVKDSYNNSKELTAFKNESMKIILNFDPLQHHGWFQINESDLLNYPEDYLPITILEHSKIIYPEEPSLQLNLKVKLNLDYKTSLLVMLNQFENRITNNWKPKNIYQLKSVLSQIMLIPCLYYSAINNKGIFKRESFDSVESDFSYNEWMPITVATHIRTNWNYSLNGLQKKLFRISNSRLRKIVILFLSPRINKDINEHLNEEFYSNLILLTRKIKKTIL